MSIFQADAVLKMSVELMIEDMRNNLWLVDDVFANFKNNPYLKKKYQTQIQDAKDWFANNRVFIEMGYPDDTSDLPRISIILGDETQDSSMSTMGDGSPITTKLLPNCIDRPIPYILEPFVPVSYDIGSGILQVPVSNLKNFYQVVPGMLLVNTATAKGFPIQQVIGTNMIMLNDGSNIGPGNLAVVPKYPFYEAKIEHVWQNVNYQVVCTGTSSQNCIWLHNIVQYGLLRYKQGLLEALGLYESLFNSTPLGQNPDLTNAGEEVWERAINITGKTQTTFIKAPHRIVESASLTNTSPNTPANPTANPSPVPTAQSGWLGGIEIQSNSQPFTTQQEQDSLWFPVNEGDED